MRGLLILLLVTLLASCTTARRSNSQCAWRVCVSHVDGPAGREYVATNSEPVPVTITMIFRTVDNLRPPPGGRVEAVVPADSSTTLVRLASVRMGRPLGAGVAVQVDLGSSSSPVDEDFLYAVPFGGSEARRLIQGFEGPETHRGSMRYSLDFAMPEGTPVLAARDGQVLLVQDGFVEGGADPDLLERANIVVVAHADGSMASYGHLLRGVRVRVGQPVHQGQLLGFSGATGYAGQPHLHFHVGKRMLGEPGRTIPIRLKDAAGLPLAPKAGDLVEPATRAEGRP